MKWLRCRDNGTDTWGWMEGDEAVLVDGSPFGEYRASGRRLPLAELEWLAPCQPSKMLALWNNFAASAAKNGWTRPQEPLWFLKSPNSFAAHQQPIPLPSGYDGRVAYEGELAIIISRRTRAINADQAKASILGYSCANDVTAIELLQRDPSFPQWSRAKGFDGFGVFGPVIDTEFDPAAGRSRRPSRDRGAPACPDHRWRDPALSARLPVRQFRLPPVQTIAPNSQDRPRLPQ
jgi:2-keto-4-pentenoate hydratase/2-oxohepta-3-ene-1,7-dioic acid hydratase in catechol pathway